LMNQKMRLMRGGMENSFNLTMESDDSSRWNSAEVRDLELRS